MATDLTRLDLRSRRRSAVGYSLGMAAYTLVIVALYPSFKDDAGLDQTFAQSEGLAAVFGISGSITTPDGWMNANLYANIGPLILLLLTIGYGAAAIAGEAEAGRLDLVAALPISRRGIVLQKAACMGLLTLLVVVVTFLVVLLGRAFQLDLDVWHLATTTLGMGLLAMFFGLVALFVGAATGQRGLAIGIPAAAAAAAYLLNSLASVVSALRPWRVLSPFYWSVGDDQLAHGLGWGGAAILLGICVVALAAAVVAMERHDLA
jgi:ABC-2 type transport system permease protein